MESTSAEEPTKNEQGKREELENKVRQQERTDNPKYIRDPIHNIIRIDDEVVVDVLDSVPMQRLRNIKQLPFTSIVYPCADHSRFAHSLGVYHLAVRMLDQLHISDTYERLVVKLAALLHDIGHGPFSHLFERFLADVKYQTPEFRKHENWTKKIILEDPSLLSRFDKISPQLKNDVADVITKTHKNRYLSLIVSSQFDVDRLDYMLRDSHMTGVQYGRFDLEWLFRNLSLEDVERQDEDGQPTGTEKKIAIDARRGLSCLEDYLLGNLYLYKHVYYHKTVLVAEHMMIQILRRAVELLKQNTDIGVHNHALQKISENTPLSTEEYMELDDTIVMSWMSHWSRNAADDTLRELSRDLLSRCLLKAVLISGIRGSHHSDLIKRIEKLLRERNLEPSYYLIQCEPSRSAYKDFYWFRAERKPDEEIICKDAKGEKVEYGALCEGNAVSQAILKLKLDEEYVIVPQAIERDVRAILEEG